MLEMYPLGPQLPFKLSHYKAGRAISFVHVELTEA